MVDVNIFMGITAMIISVGFFSHFFFQRTKIPDVLWLLFVGLLIGPVFGLVNQSILMSIAPFFSAVALLIILFDSGLEMDLNTLLRSTANSTIMAVLGFILSLLFVSVPAFLLFGLSLFNSLLLGAIVGGTSSAIVLTVTKRLDGMKPELKTVLSMESVINDPLVIVVSILIIQTQLGIGLGASSLLSSIFGIFSLSIFLGLAFGIFWSHMLARIQAYEYHHMLTLAMLFIAYALSELLNGSGAITALVIGIVLSNFKRFTRFFRGVKMIGLTSRTREFNSYISFFVRTFFFVFLGVIISLKRYDLIMYGLVLTAFLLAARYATAYIMSKRMNLGRKDILLTTFLFPKGLAAAVVATIPFAQYRLPGTDIFADMVFTIILASSIISTLGVGYVERQKQAVSEQKQS